MNTIATVSPPTYPLRPVNGGPLDKALPKSSMWLFEPKYNGWRVIVHVPTGACFNRKNEPLSIAGCFQPALTRLRELSDAHYNSTGHRLEWLDCEGLERRHEVGRGTLILLDWMTPRMSYEARHKELRKLGLFCHDYMALPDDNHVYLPASVMGPDGGEAQLWEDLEKANWKFGCEFYEGVVAKRASSCYPFQLRSYKEEFPFWMKHRWAF